MAHGANEPQFTGLAKYFNTFTNTGRANFTKATLGTAALVVLIMKLKPKKKEAPK